MRPATYRPFGKSMERQLRAAALMAEQIVETGSSDIRIKHALLPDDYPCPAMQEFNERTQAIAQSMASSLRRQRQARRLSYRNNDLPLKRLSKM